MDFASDPERRRAGVGAPHGPHAGQVMDRIFAMEHTKPRTYPYPYIYIYIYTHCFGTMNRLLLLLIFWVQQVVILILALLASVVVWHRLVVNSSSPHDRQSQQEDNVVMIAFFHPHCSAGGGGERVLWKMIQVLGNMVDNNNNDEKNSKTARKTYRVMIYTVDPDSDTYENDVRQHVLDRFSLSLSARLSLSFVHLNDHAHLLRPARSFSLLVESLGAMQLAYIALRRSTSTPDIFIDTTGCAFTYVPAVLLFGCQVLAYVHYPTISTDMLKLVWERRRTAYNHSEYIAKSAWNTYIKLVYYVLFAVLYGLVGSLATHVMVNSTWTYNHIRSLWKLAAWRNRIRIVYPPCSLAVPLPPSSATKTERKPVILSIGQFRPEKDHVLQIESMAQLLQNHPEIQAKLVLIGSCRDNAADQKRLEQLQSLCQSLHINDSMEFVVNQPFDVLLSWLGTATAGIHTVRVKKRQQ
jgi:alpha-1,2-mannosyltransferase